MSSSHTLGDSSDKDQKSGGSRSSRAPKGNVHLDRLIVQRAKGIIKDVPVNYLGQPIGPVGAELQSYIGVLSRRHVKISFESWSDVPQESKDIIWDSVKLVYNVDDSWKRQCLCSANTKWRQWKCSLKKKYIVPHENKPAKLVVPPSDPRIHKNDWKLFVINSTSEKSRRKSQELKERQRNNLYPHHVSRKGYSGLREEMKDQLTGDEEVDRALLWKQARVNKNGEFDSEKLTQTAMKIEEYVRQKEDGVFCKTQPTDDILTQALEKPEHSGRLRGVGGHVTPTIYFNLPKRLKTENDKVIKELKLEFGKQMAEMNSRILQLQEQVMKKDSENIDSCSHLGSKKKDVDDEDIVEIPPDDACSLVKQRQKKVKRYVEQPNKLKATDLPKSLKLLHNYARDALKDGLGITLPVEPNVFGEDDHIVYLFFDDILPLCELQPIRASCICAYIWHLYKECENANMLDKIRFVNPYKVSYNSNEDLTKKSKCISERLSGAITNQLVLMPCNVGYHWILMVIDPHNEIVYVLDPLYDSDHIKGWKNIMEMAIKMFNMNIGKRGRRSLLWEVVKCQQQPDDKQCGFYVMRYMKEIIENCGSNSPLSIHLLFSDGFYSKKEIDEVRMEWAEFVTDFTD